MVDNVRLVSTKKLKRNPDNPRLVFRETDLLKLEESIREQGILVPLTVYQAGTWFKLLDGERRWLCARRIGLRTVPVITQPKPGRLENIMMMFAIHNTRRDWDPLPTAYSLEKLSKEYEARQGVEPTEAQLAQLASISRGEVRRLRMLLSLPKRERDELMQELEKPKSERTLTADQVLEASRASVQLRKRGIVDAGEERRLRRAIVSKFRSGVIKNTVAPRKLARIARAVERDDLSRRSAKRVVGRLLSVASYSIDDAFRDSVERTDYIHGSNVLAERLAKRLSEQVDSGYEPTEELRHSLSELRSLINRILRG